MAFSIPNKTNHIQSVSTYTFVLSLPFNATRTRLQMPAIVPPTFTIQHPQIIIKVSFKAIKTFPPLYILIIHVVMRNDLGVIKPINPFKISQSVSQSGRGLMMAPLSAHVHATIPKIVLCGAFGTELPPISVPFAPAPLGALQNRLVI